MWGKRIIHTKARSNWISSCLWNILLRWKGWRRWRNIKNSNHFVRVCNLRVLLSYYILLWGRLCSFHKQGFTQELQSATRFQWWFLVCKHHYCPLNRFLLNFRSMYIQRVTLEFSKHGPIEYSLFIWVSYEFMVPSIIRNRKDHLLRSTRTNKVVNCIPTGQKHWQIHMKMT